MEQNKTPDQEYMEKMKVDIAERLERARNNPIESTRLGELEEQISNLQNEFIKNGYRDAEQIAKEEEVEAEIMRSTAVADNLPEYKEMLQQVAVMYEKDQVFVDNLLAHENSHANIAQATEHEWVGYGSVFYKNPDGNIDIQPVHFTKPQMSWGPKEVITKGIEVTNAPEVYGDKLSDGDEASLVEQKEQLDRIKLQEERAEQDKAKADQLRVELGIGE